MQPSYTRSADVTLCRPLNDRWRSCASTLLLVTIAICVVAAFDAQENAGTGSRTIEWRPDRTIESQMLPNDGVLIVRAPAFDAITPHRQLSVTDVVNDLALRAELVALVDVNESGAVLSHNDSWVDTRLSGSVTRVVRISKAVRFRLHDRVEVRVSGGQIKLGSVVVNAITQTMPVAPTIPLDRTYLMFLRNIDGNLTALHPPLLVEKNKVAYLAPWKQPMYPDNPLQGLSVDRLVNTVRRAHTSWSQTPEHPRKR